MTDKNLDAAESLALIARMIENTRNRLKRNAGRPFLVWGYLTVVFTLAVWSAVACSGDARWNLLWLGLPAAGALGIYLTRARGGQQSVRTFVDRVIGQIWTVTGFAACLLALLALFTPVRPPMLFLIVLLMGIGTAATGLIVRFRPSAFGGFAGIVLAPGLLVAPDASWSAGLFIGAFVAMMIVPGHILNRKSNRPTQNHV